MACIPSNYKFLLFLLFSPLLLLGQNLIRGSFYSPLGWSLPSNARLDYQVFKTSPPSLRMEGPSWASYTIFVEEGETLTLSGWIKTENITPIAEKGYAFLAVYQYDALGNLLAFKDIAQPIGTQDWTFYQYTFTTVPGVFTLSVPCGIFQASGVAWFDDLALTKGEKPMAVSQEKKMMPSGRRIAIFRDDIPVKGTATSPDLLASLMRDAGYSPTFLSSQDLREKLSRDEFDLLILPYGESFPSDASKSLFNFLKEGGALLTMGGYAFQNPLYKQGDHWLTEEEFNETKPNLLIHGDFESEDKWEKIGNCALDEAIYHEGKRSGKVWLEEVGSAEWRQELNLQPGRTYRLTGWAQGEDVKGQFGFVAIYCYDEEGRITYFRDVVHLKGTSLWQSFQWDFLVPPTTKRVIIRCGLYQAKGTAWFDALKLRERVETHINTAKGQPMDGLVVQPFQIAIFDPSYKLEKVAYAKTAEDQAIVKEDIRIEGPLTGYAAVTVTGSDEARWIPLFKGYDRYGRLRGTIGAIAHRYGGFYATSSWAFFGVDNQDLFKSPAMQKALLSIVDHLLTRTYLHNLSSDFACYKQGEKVNLSVKVSNFGRDRAQGEVRFTIYEGNGREVFSQTLPLEIAFGETRTLEAIWAPDKFSDSLYRLTATLYIEGKEWDRMESGFMVWDDGILKKALKMIYKDNYLYLEGKPRFLLGTDYYSDTFFTASENPLLWDKELRRLKDHGVDLYENLWISPASYQYDVPEDIWRKTDALALLTQKHNLVFFPCILCGYDVAVSDEEIARQRTLAEKFAQRYKGIPALIYYINGDLQFNEDNARRHHRSLFNEFLRRKYGSESELEKAWGRKPQGEWGDIELPPPQWGNWEDVASADVLSFYGFLGSRWIDNIVDALKGVDPQHPTTCEFYKFPWLIDLRDQINNLDISNIGYFGLPREDVEQLPAFLKYHDMRAVGKTFSLGEFGAKTHPAWQAGFDYHIQRSEEERNKLFLACIFYPFGMGASRAQNWCFKDPLSSIFPWGLFYPGDGVAKECALVMRAGGLLLRHLNPAPPTPPSVYFLIPTQNRISGGKIQVFESILRSINALLSLGVDFYVIDEPHIDRIPPNVKTIIYPLPLCPPPEVYESLKDFVQRGGNLFISGDLSFDNARRRTQTQRLEELCGVRFLEEVGKPFAELPPRSPLIKVEPITAKKVLGEDLLFQQDLGKGKVFFTPYAEETRTASDLMGEIYGTFLRSAGVRTTEGIHPQDPSLHRFRLPLLNGEAVILFNQGSEKEVSVELGGRKVKLSIGENMPALVARNRENGIFALVGKGKVEIDGKPILNSQPHFVILALDQKDIASSSALLLLPLEEGRISWGRRLSMEIGEIEDGKWRTLEQRTSTLSLSVDGDIRFTPCLLLTDASQREKWLKEVLAP